MRDSSLKVLHMQVPPEIFDRLKARAQRERRSMTQQLVVLLEQVLAHEPEAKATAESCP